MNSFRENAIQIDDLQFKYLEWGDDGMPTILLLNGNGDNPMDWAIFAESMSSDFNVFALDNRRHFRCRENIGTPGNDLCQVDTIDRFVFGIASEDTLVIGHGAGALDAVAYTARNPDRVSALVVVDSDLSDQEKWNDLSEISCPLLIARGRLSTVMSHAMAVKMREMSSNSCLVELEGATHRFHHEMPVAFETMVRWFIKKSPPEGM